MEKLLKFAVMHDLAEVNFNNVLLFIKIQLIKIFYQYKKYKAVAGDITPSMNVNIKLI